MAVIEVGADLVESAFYVIFLDLFNTRRLKGKKANRAEKSKDIIYGTNYISLNICDVTDDVLAYYCMIIDQYKPKWIQFIPHIALMLVNYMKKNDIEPVSTLKYIEYNEVILACRKLC